MTFQPSPLMMPSFTLLPSKILLNSSRTRNFDGKSLKVSGEVEEGIRPVFPTIVQVNLWDPSIGSKRVSRAGP